MLRTFAMQEERLPASSRARPRRRSYSASALDEEWWLKAGDSGGQVSTGVNWKRCVSSDAPPPPN